MIYGQLVNAMTRGHIIPTNENTMEMGKSAALAMVSQRYRIPIVYSHRQSEALYLANGAMLMHIDDCHEAYPKYYLIDDHESNILDMALSTIRRYPIGGFKLFERIISPLYMEEELDAEEEQDLQTLYRMNGFLLEALGRAPTNSEMIKIDKEVAPTVVTTVTDTSAQVVGPNLSYDTTNWLTPATIAAREDPLIEFALYQEPQVRMRDPHVRAETIGDRETEDVF